MKFRGYYITVGKEVKITFNGKEEIGKVLSITEHGFWFNNDSIDKSFKWGELDPEMEYLTGNKLHLDYNRG